MTKWRAAARGHSSDGALDEAIDEAEDQSFPASDPQSSWAGPDCPEPGRGSRGSRRG